MKNSTIPPELEIDQQITTFSLGIVKNLFSKVGLSQEEDLPIKPVISIPRESTTTRDSIFSSPSSSQQPRRSSLRPSFTNSFEFWDDRLTLSPITEGSSRRSSSATPMSNMNKNDKREKLEFSIQIIDAEESPHAVSGISCFTDNLGLDQSIDYSYSLGSVVLTHREDFASRLYKQGCLWKKSTKLLVGWQKRYFEVKPYKISYASSPENLKTRHQVRSINLLVHLCELVEIKENTFTIKIEGIDKHLKLRCETFQETMEWVDFLKEFFKYAKEHCYKNGKYFRHQRKTLVKSDMFTEEDFLQEADTGDLLLFKSVASPSSSSNGKYSHVALVVKAFDDIYIYDTVNNKDVRLNNWKDFKQLKEYKKYKMATFRKLHIDNPDMKGLISLRIYKNIMNRSGALSDPSLNTLFEKVILVPDSPENTTKRLASLSTTQTTILSPNLASPLSSPEKVGKADEKMLSGQLIAALYKDIGLLDASMPIAKYLPSTFAKNIKLLKGGYLSSEYELVFLN